MDIVLYRAAMEGEVDILIENRAILEHQLTPTNNTLLHVAVLYGQTECVNTILTICSSVLLNSNHKGDTALHIAAKLGHLEIAGALVDQGRETLATKTNEDGDTALHVVLRSLYCDVELVKLLIGNDGEFAYLPNNDEETPLYLAAERGLDDCVSQILRYSRSPSPDGPVGRTALHAAAIFDSQGSVAELLQWEEGILSKKVDKYGWTALHYAARLGNLQTVMQLIQFDQSLAYAPANDGEENDNSSNTTSVLHIAATHGHVKIIKHIISHCPDSSEMVNSRGESILHVAVKNRKADVIKFILEDPFLESLVTQKDKDGNTPLHVLVILPDFNSFGKKLLRHSKTRTAMKIFNNENMIPTDVHLHKAIQAPISQGRLIPRNEEYGQRNIVSNDKQAAIETKKKHSIEFLQKSAKESKTNSQRNMVVASLIATITFAAAFTLPGGYDDKPGSRHGTAVLSKSKAFQAFLITDTIATMCSSLAVFIYFSVSIRLKPSMELAEFAGFLLLYSRIAMLVAFITGVYATMRHELAVSIFVCIIGSVAYCVPFQRSLINSCA